MIWRVVIIALLCGCIDISPPPDGAPAAASYLESIDIGAEPRGVCGAQCSSDLNCATGGLKACNKCFFGTCYPLLPPIIEQPSASTR
jgi:hypothetical protein